MTDLRQALRTAVATPPPDEIDLVGVLASGRRARGRRRRWVVTAIAAATATVTIAGFSVVALVTGGDDNGDPQPADPDRTRRNERAIDPLGPPRDFAADPVLDFEPDAPLLREGDVVLGRPDDHLEAAYLTEDLQVLVSGRQREGSRYGLIDPASPTEVDWLPAYPGAGEVLPLCGYLVRKEGDCVQGERSLWFYVWSAPDLSRIDYLRFDRVTREWSVTPRAPRATGAAVSAQVVEDRRLVIDGPAGRHVVRLDRDPICDSREDLVLGPAPDFEPPHARVEGDFVVVDYYCSTLFDPGSGKWGVAVFDDRGRLLVHPPTEGGSVSLTVVGDRLLAYHGMLVDLAGGHVYRLLRTEPHGIGAGWLSAYASVHSARGGLVVWTENHLAESSPATDLEDGTVHLTPLPGG